MFNVKDDTNLDFRRRILLGRIKPEAVVSMTFSDMASEQRKKETEGIKAKSMFECELGATAVASTDQFKCGKCLQRKTTYSRCRQGACWVLMLIGNFVLTISKSGCLVFFSQLQLTDGLFNHDKDGSFVQKVGTFLLFWLKSQMQQEVTELGDTFCSNDSVRKLIRFTSRFWNTQNNSVRWRMGAIYHAQACSSCIFSRDNIYPLTS